MDGLKICVSPTGIFPAIVAVRVSIMLYRYDASRKHYSGEGKRPSSVQDVEIILEEKCKTIKYGIKVRAEKKQCSSAILLGMCVLKSISLIHH